MAVEPDQPPVVATTSQADITLAVDLVEEAFPDEVFYVGRGAVERLAEGNTQLSPAAGQLEGAEHFDYQATLTFVKDAAQLVLALFGIYRTILEIQKLRNESGSLADRIEKLALETFPNLSPELRASLRKLIERTIARLPKP